MPFGKKNNADQEVPPEDPTGWLIDSSLAEFLLLHTVEIKYMAMLAYTYVHGTKLFATLPENSSTSYKFVSMILQCTGGGILVPIFINAIPVPLAVDAYPIAILCSFFLHMKFPILRDVMKLSPILKVALIVLYEVMRASVVVKLTTAAGKAIAPSEFDFPVFGPIMLGTIAGCGGAFLPLNKGLDPIKQDGLAQPMLSAFIGATFFHLFTHTSMSEGVEKADKKAHVLITCFFIAHHLSTVFMPAETKGKVTKEVGAIEGKKKGESKKAQ